MKMSNTDMDLDDFEYQQDVVLSGNPGCLDDYEDYKTDPLTDRLEYRKAPQAPQRAVQRDELGFEVTPPPFYEYNEEATEEVTEYDDFSGGCASFWDSVEYHGSFFFPANADWRANQHLERYYRNDPVTGEPVEPSKYEQARGRAVIRKLREDNPEYYRSKNQKHNREYRERNKEKIAARRKKIAQTPEAKAKKALQQRKYRAKLKAQKQSS
jgi:alpha-ketoglutarate-dependent taurine dioxygenase